MLYFVIAYVASVININIKAAVFGSILSLVLDGLHLTNWHIQCSLILGMEQQTEQLLDFSFKLFLKEVAYL